MNRLRFRVWDKEEKKFANWPVYFNLTSSEVVTELWYGYEIQIEEPLQDSNYIVQQSTGLLDKNGKEIFEGDILKYRDEYRVVEMYDGAWVARTGEKQLIVKMVVLSGAEIIGNKFENRELLDYDSE